MKPKTWGIILIIIAVLLNLITALVKIIIELRCQCSTSFMVYTFIWFLGGLIAVGGFMLFRSGDVAKHVAESQRKMNEDLKKAKIKEREKDHFKEFLKGFSKQETEVIEYVHTYEGLTMNDLAGKVGLSRATLEKILKKLEKRGTVSVMDGKLYLVLKK